MDLADRVNVIAIGVGSYSHLPPLQGPAQDVDGLEHLLVRNAATSVVDGSRFRALLDPDSCAARLTLAEYCLARSAPNDILIFYFSGHAIPLGQGDLGLCLRDTRVHDGFMAALPLNLLRFSDIVQSLASVKVDPVMILDTCFSGQAASQLVVAIPPFLNATIQLCTGSSYALLCSSSRTGESLDLSTGGLFSTSLRKVALAGRSDKEYRRRSTLTVSDIFQALKEEVAKIAAEPPQLFLGQTLPQFAFVRNVQYRPLRYHLGSHRRSLLAFWDSGRCPSLTSRDLHGLGMTVYTTHHKLSSLPAWGLLEDLQGGARRLSSLGVLFMEGKLRVPDLIEKDPTTGEWVAAADANLVKFDELEPASPQGVAFGDTDSDD